ncbi:MAG: hypothetical protein Q9207_002761 [Kuettlingeria erythrocarpa]
MVYVAWGALALSSLPFAYYVYKHYEWRISARDLRSKGDTHHQTPEITIGSPRRADNNAESDDRPTESLKGLPTTYDDPSFNASVDRDDPSPGIDQKKSPPGSALPALLGKREEDVIDKHSTERKEEDGSKEAVCMGNSTATISSAIMQPPSRPGPRLRPKASNSMAPPAVDHSYGNALRLPPTLASSLRPPPSAASTLRGPPNRSLGSPGSLAPTASTLPSSKRASKKVLLEPGHSPLDWANLVNKPPSTTYLRGDDVSPNLLRVPPSLLRYHNGRKGKNAWGVWQGKVYNLTPYMKFHPGGVDELMKGAGREKDGERLFLEIHPWVNWEGLLGECLIGILVSEEESKSAQDEAGGLEDMD